MSDSDLVDLVTAAQRGDALAMQELLGLLTPYVGKLCGPIALQDGPDATQEALIAIFRNLGRLTEPAAVFGWARTIAVRAAVRVARAASRQGVAAPLEDVPAVGDPLLASDIRDVLDRLSPEHRAVLVLRDLEGLDERTVGAVLAVPTGTVKSRLFRARTSFRKAWVR
jgi:RNA polymerase sigma factor (sigma-70 family)